MRQSYDTSAGGLFELEGISTAEIPNESVPETMHGRAVGALRALCRSKIGQALMFLFAGFHAFTALEENAKAEESGAPEEANVLNVSTIFGTGEEAKLIKRYGPEIKKILSVDLSKAPGTPGHFIGLHDKFFFRHGADRNIYVHEYDQAKNELPVHTVIQRPDLPPSDSIEDAFVSNGHVFYGTWTKATQTGYLAIIPLNVKDTNEKRELSAGEAQILSFPDNSNPSAIFIEEENRVYILFGFQKTKQPGVRSFALKDGKWVQDFEKGIDPNCGDIGIFTGNDGKKFLASAGGSPGGVYLQSIDNPDEPSIFFSVPELEEATIYDIHQLEGTDVLIGATDGWGKGLTLIQDFGDFSKLPLKFDATATACGTLPHSKAVVCGVTIVVPEGNGIYAVQEQLEGPGGEPVITPGKAGDNAFVNFDKDKDGKPDLFDNCPEKANFDQTNKDGDGLGDVCDPYTSPQKPDSESAAETEKEKETSEGGEIDEAEDQLPDASESELESADTESEPEADKSDAMEHEVDTEDSFSPEVTPEIAKETLDIAKETNAAGDNGNHDSDDGSCAPVKNPPAPWYQLAAAAVLGFILRRKSRNVSE